MGTVRRWTFTVGLVVSIVILMLGFAYFRVSVAQPGCDSFRKIPSEGQYTAQNPPEWVTIYTVPDNVWVVVEHRTGFIDIVGPGKKFIGYPVTSCTTEDDAIQALSRINRDRKKEISP